jgi:acyl transferase domain-containing protein
MPTTESHFCHIGSIKGNLGHLTAGAGIAGLIKVALACHKAELPPSIHIREANSKLQLTGSPFTLQRQLGPWPAPQGERWAGVSSFGVGGTNAHLVLCDPPPQSRPAPSPESPSLAVIGVSGFDEAACKRTQQQLCESWPQDPDHLVNLAYTLLARRWPFKHRSFTLQTTPPDANAKWLSGEAFTTFKTVWTLPGQGSQTSGMAQGLWHNAPQFREILHTGCTQIKHDHGLDLLPLLLENSDQDQQLQQTQYAQPALFLFQYALGRQLQDWGLQPDVLIGHSIGEIAAAALSGVLSFPDALHLVATRGRLMQALPPGAMMQINLSYDQWDAAAFPELDCAAINGVDRIVLAGPPEAITEAQSKLTSQSIDCRRLKTSHAFHSRMMEPMLEDFRNAIADCQFDSPNIPIISTSRTATSANGSPNRWGADYWANHIRQCVRFAPALQAYLNDQTDTAIICLELGPGRVLSSLSQPLFQRRHEQVAVALQAPRKTADHSPTDPTSCASNQWQALLKGLGQYWLKGGRLNWSQIPGHRGRHVSAPTYPFGGERYWLEPATQPRPSELSVASKPAASSIQGDTVMTDHWQQTILQRLKDLLSDITGIHADEIASEADFFELGLDSLFLTQFANRLKREFAVNISFRQLSSELARIDQLAEYLAQNTDAPPSSVTAEAADAPPPQASPLMSASTNQAGTKQPQPTSARPQTGSGNSLEAIVQQQLELMSQQINLLQQGKVSSPMTRPPAPASQVHASPTQALTHPANQDDRNFGPQTRIHRGKASLSADQEDYLRQVIQRFNAKTAASKASTAKNRAHLADPRTVNGFQPWLKEAVYPLVAHEAKGPRFWDLDGNAYYDLLAGYGSNMFGWQAPFIQQAIADQLDRGMPIGPQFELVGETSELAATMVGHDRVAWCNTGSEAVLAALRIARTVTGRHKVVVFDGAYHGLFDEVIVRAGRNGKSTPAAPGINPSSVENMIVLPYDSTESLAQIEAYRDEIAAILVEPIQSRHPACQPISFLRQLQQLTRDLGLLLIFDEVITGFRCHPAGFQGYSGIKADLATYGKVLGGGMPVGLVAGRQELMDVLDGGLWQYGDQSLPEAGVTYFAGTFVRHPLAIRCAHAVLKHLNDQGESLHDQLNDSATRFATTINQIIAEYGAPLHLETFGSLMMLRRLHCENTRSSTAFDQLIDLWLKDRGVHLSWGYPCFLTTVHTMEDEQHCATAFADSLDDLINHGFLERTSQNTTQPISQPTLQTSRQQQTQDEETEPQREPAPQPYLPHGWQPQPAPNARLGRDQTGQPAWFIPDPDRPGAYCQLVAKDGS